MTLRVPVPRLLTPFLGGLVMLVASGLVIVLGCNEIGKGGLSTVQLFEVAAGVILSLFSLYCITGVLASPRTISLTDSGITIRCVARHRFYRWDAISRLTEINSRNGECIALKIYLNSDRSPFIMRRWTIGPQFPAFVTEAVAAHKAAVRV